MARRIPGDALCDTELCWPFWRPTYHVGVIRIMFLAMRDYGQTLPHVGTSKRVCSPLQQTPAELGHTETYDPDLLLVDSLDPRYRQLNVPIWN